LEERDKKWFFLNAIDTLQFHRNDSRKVRKELQNKYGIREKNKTVVFVRKIIANKGIFELIQAFNKCEF